MIPLYVTSKSSWMFSTCTPFPPPSLYKPSFFNFFFHVTSFSSLCILMVFCWIWSSTGREENWMQNSRCALPAGISSLDLLAVLITQLSPWAAFVAGSWHCSWMKVGVVLIIWRRLSLQVKYFRNFRNNIWKKISKLRNILLSDFSCI